MNSQSSELEETNLCSTVETTLGNFIHFSKKIDHWKFHKHLNGIFMSDYSDNWAGDTLEED